MYYPTHQEILDLPSVKRNIAEFKKLGLDVAVICNTGTRAYNNGTRKIQMPAWVWRTKSKYMYEEFAIYPDRGTVISVPNGYTIKQVAPLKTLEDWDNLFQLLFELKFSPDFYRAEISTSVVELDELARSKDTRIKGRVANNKHTSPDTLRKLWKSSKAEVVFDGLLTNPNLPSDILALIYKKRESFASRYHTSDTWIEARIMENPNTPIEILLGADWNEYPTAREIVVNSADKLTSEQDRNRILGLITMKDMGIPISNEPIDLSKIEI
jgi:hypothetical protein